MDNEYSFTQKEIEEGKTMGILAYILFLIPLFTAREKRFAMFHTEQAIVLCIIAVILGVIGSALSFTCIIPVVTGIAGLGLMVLWVIGLINSIQGQAKFIPLVGKFGPKLGLCNQGNNSYVNQTTPQKESEETEEPNKN